MGSPRSGTTFTGKALGRVPGIKDIGEAPAVKYVIPHLYPTKAEQPSQAAAVLRRVVKRSARAAMVGRDRPLEQTPESSFVITDLAMAFPEAQFIHLIRDGRDVTASLLERGWLAGTGDEQVAARAKGNIVDDADQPFGGFARFWVEPERAAEFVAADEITRCIWAWRSYETAAQTALTKLTTSRVIDIRYESLVTSPDVVATTTAARLGLTDAQPLIRAFSKAHANSVGRYQSVLTSHQIHQVEGEAGELLNALGYPTSR